MLTLLNKREKRRIPFRVVHSSLKFDIYHAAYLMLVKIDPEQAKRTMGVEATETINEMMMRSSGERLMNVVASYNSPKPPLASPESCEDEEEKDEEKEEEEKAKL
ncbi:unnamed protein product [Orchesella dallaii]|uniref:Uncharacterized protein n=1 Tax=Orchesella dallaii TaxID=48710 RepID=A0ABP1PZP2_9HEXA